MRICVYMASREGAEPIYREEAVHLANVMAARGHGLVYGGASSGLMGAVADVMVKAGAETYGVIPKALYDLEVAHQELDELIITKDMHERKKAMLDHADAFIALPGGLGTFEELFEALTWQQLGYHQKPVGLLNSSGYYDELLAFMENAVRAGFISEAHKNTLLVGNSVDEILDKIETAEVVYIPKNVTK